MSLLTDLIGAWELDEASGDALDSHGTNDLTDNNTVGSGTGLVYGTARDFEVSNSEFFSHADNADLSTGDIDFTFEAWVNLESLLGHQIIVGKDDNALGREIIFSYNDGGASNRFGLVVIGGGVGQVVANTFGAPSSGTWYHVVAWHDAVNNELGIAVNAGTADTASYSSGVNDSGAAFCIGARTYAGSEGYFDGLIGPVRFWKRVLTSQERTDLYNGGAGLAYSAFNPAPPATRRWLLVRR